MTKNNVNKNIDNSPWMILIVGPNGAGKTTFYQKTLKEDPLISSAEFINCDEEALNIARQIKWQNIRQLLKEKKLKEAFMLARTRPDVSEYSVQYQAGRNTSKKLRKKIEEKRNFIYETTGSGASHLATIKSAKQNGYKIATIFVGLSSAKLSQARVHERVLNGGHDVPTEDIQRRYPKVLERLPDLLRLSDVAALFDNSSKEAYKPIFLMDENQFLIFDKYPKWTKDALKDCKTHKEMFRFSMKDFKSLPDEDQSSIIQNLVQIMSGSQNSN